MFSKFLGTIQGSTLVKFAAGILLSLLLPLSGAITTDAPAIWPFATMVYNLGLWGVFATIPRKGVRLIAYSSVAAVFFMVEAAYFFSFYLQDAGFNEAFFYHLRPDLIYAGVQEHLPLLLTVVVCLVGFLWLSSLALARDNFWNYRWTPLMLGLICLGFFASPSLKDFTNHAVARPQESQQSALWAELGESVEPKISADFSKTAKPNIILIYAESLEQRYFDEAIFPGLVPNLKRLKEQSLDFVNISQALGAEWTVAGLVASQCGYPLAGAHDIEGSELAIFRDFLPRATCMGDLLEKDGYFLTFIGGADSRFAGKGNFLHSHGYQEVLDRHDIVESMVDKSYLHSWGLFDDSTFEFATKRFWALSRQNTPFLLSLLTLDTHHPNGFLSKACGIYGSGDNSILNAVHCSDQLISGFIDKIRESPFSNNTVVIVVSDHLAMRNQATALLEKSTLPKRLLFFVNMPDGSKEKNANPGLHYDIAPTVLDLVGYQISGEHMGLGRTLAQGGGYLPIKFGEDRWKEHSDTLMALGKALWDKEVMLDERGILLSKSGFSLSAGGIDFNLRSSSFSAVPGSFIFIFDDRSLRLEKIIPFPAEQWLAPTTLSCELLMYKNKLVLVESRAENLPGFSDPRNPPEAQVFFFGKPGSKMFSWGTLDEDVVIPSELIRKLAQETTVDEVIRERENILKFIESNRLPAQGRGSQGEG